MRIFFVSLYVKPKKEKRPSAGHKSTKKSGLTQVISRIKSELSEKCHAWHISLDDMTSNESCRMLHAHTIGRSAASDWRASITTRRMITTSVRWDSTWNAQVPSIRRRRADSGHSPPSTGRGTARVVRSDGDAIRAGSRQGRSRPTIS